MILAIIGFCVGTIGTLIGAGGGFMLVPILLFLYPQWAPEKVTGVSMVTVAFNAISGSIAYFKQKKIHLKSGIIFAISCMPGAFFGVLINHYVNKATFEKIFGVALILYAVLLLVKKLRDNHAVQTITDFSLTTNKYIIGIIFGILIGFIASFLGIGGGVIHVPLLTQILHYPVHFATGTSHFILAITAVITSLVHLQQGDISIFDKEIWQLAIGVIVGAQLGARLSSRVPGKIILKILAVALLGVGIRLLVRR